MRLMLASRRNARVYSYWVSACKEREMPTHDDLQPEDIPVTVKAELPYVYIAQVMRDESGIWFKFRLMGSERSQQLYNDGIRKMLLDRRIGGWEEEWRKNLLYTVQMKMPVVDESTIKTEIGVALDVEHLAMPLSENGLDVDRIFGAIDFSLTPVPMSSITSCRHSTSRISHPWNSPNGSSSRI